MPAGRHFLQIPGPTNVPDRVLRAIDRPTIDHRGPDFQILGKEVLEGMKRIFKTRRPVVIYPASGTGAWEGALVNTLSRGDKVLMREKELGMWRAWTWNETGAAVREGFGLKPAEIIKVLALLRPISQKPAAYGHFGRELPEFTWGRVDKAEPLRSALK